MVGGQQKVFFCPVRGRTPWNMMSCQNYEYNHSQSKAVFTLDFFFFEKSPEGSAFLQATYGKRKKAAAF